MNEKIFEYEEKVYELKKELNSLIQEYESGNIQDKLIAFQKINALKNEIKSMDIQLNILKQKISSTPANQPLQQQHTLNSIKQPVERLKQQQPINPYTPPQKVINKSNRKNKDLENIIGKTIMAIVSAVLLFFGLFAFAPVILPMISDEIKVLLMFFVSGIITGVGYRMFKKDRTNKFNTVVMGCGFGAIYISLYLTAGYFNLMNEYALYTLIIIWSFVMLKLSDGDKGLKILNYVGIFISIMFAAIAKNNIPQIMVLLYVIIIESIFVIYELIKNKKIQVEDSIMIALSLYVLSFFDKSIGEINNIDDVIFLFLSFIPFMITCYYIKNIKDKNNDVLFLASCFLTIPLYLRLNIFDNKFIYIAISLMNISMILLLENKSKKLQNNKFISDIQIMPMVFASIATALTILNLSDFKSGPLFTDNKYSIGFYIIFFTLLFITLFFIFYGFKNKKKNIKIFSIFMVAAMFLGSWEELTIGVMLLIIVTVIASMIITKQSGDLSKTFLYIYILITIAYIINFTIEHIIKFTGYNFAIEDDLHALLLMLSFTLLNTSIYYTKIGRGWFNDKKEPVLNMTAFVINMIIIVCSSIAIYNIDNMFIKMFMVMLMLIPYVIAGKKFILSKDTEIITAILFTIFTIIMLTAYEAPTLIVTIDCIIVSIICILLGFAINKKTFRIYGLILSLISVVKLILIDISFKGELANAISLFICAILCLGISYIYNIVDKKYKNK